VKIIEELKKRNFKIATIKHSHHKMEMDRENTDTWKHKEAGSDTVVGIGNRAFFNISKEMSLERLLFLIKFIEEPDFVVIEGFKSYSYAKITTSPELIDDFTIKSVDAFTITDDEISSLVDTIENLSYDILNTLHSNECGYFGGENIGKAIINKEINFNSNTEVFLSIDEKVIGLNFFVNNFLKQTILGMLKSLKTKEFGVEEFKKIELLIKNEKVKK
jgi:molybdopterin-guanine dinucleotide biosynthesis protein B